MWRGGHTRISSIHWNCLLTSMRVVNQHLHIWVTVLSQKSMAGPVIEGNMELPQVKEFRYLRSEQWRIIVNRSRQAVSLTVSVPECSGEEELSFEAKLCHLVRLSTRPMWSWTSGLNCRNDIVRTNGWNSFPLQCWAVTLGDVVRSSVIRKDSKCVLMTEEMKTQLSFIWSDSFWWHPFGSLLYRPDW